MGIRVVIVEDSVVIQKAIADLCREDPGIDVVAVAGTGEEGVAQICQLRPDVVILDIGLPDVDGFEVVRQVMAKVPTPILIFTATLKPSGRPPAFDALGLGAIEVKLKPEGRELNDPKWREVFRRELKLIACAPVIPHVLSIVRQVRRREPQGERAEAPAVLAIVGSAGSPRAVSVLLQELKPVFPLPIPVIVALHLGRGMGGGFARHLEGLLSHRAVELGEGGELEAIRAGTIYIVPGRMHAELHKPDVARIFEELPGAAYAPSLDHLLKSIAAVQGRRATGVILSGMGADGAEGLLAIRRAGGTTLGQDERSSLVYGMPKVALGLGAVEVQDTPAALGQVLLQRLQVASLARGKA